MIWDRGTKDRGISSFARGIDVGVGLGVSPDVAEDRWPMPEDKPAAEEKPAAEPTVFDLSMKDMVARFGSLSPGDRAFVVSIIVAAEQGVRSLDAVEAVACIYRNLVTASPTGAMKASSAAKGESMGLRIWAASGGSRYYGSMAIDPASRRLLKSNWNGDEELPKNVLTYGDFVRYKRFARVMSQVRERVESVMSAPTPDSRFAGWTGQGNWGDFNNRTKTGDLPWAKSRKYYLLWLASQKTDKPLPRFHFFIRNREYSLDNPKQYNGRYTVLQNWTGIESFFRKEGAKELPKKPADVPEVEAPTPVDIP